MIRTKIDGLIYYKKENKFHNPHRYAIEYPSEEKVYYLNGSQHNIVGPQRILKDKTTTYRINGYYL